jgi:hypothetical protein
MNACGERPKNGHGRHDCSDFHRATVRRSKSAK